MKSAVISPVSFAKDYASRAKRAVAGNARVRLLRRGYATPSQRGRAMERDYLLLDSMEAGLARASMRGEGYVRIAAYLGLVGPGVEHEALKACLSTLQARHPYLRRTLVRTPLGLALKPLGGPLPIVEHELSSELQVDTLWREIEARPLRPGDALARVHLIRFAEDSDQTGLIVEGEHVIGDGASMIALACELVEQLSVCATIGAPRNRAPLALSASVNARCAAELGGHAEALRRTTQRMLDTIPRLIKQTPTTLPRDTSRGIRQCYTHAVRATLSREETEQLYQAAKAEGASLSTVFGAAMSLAIGARVLPRESENSDWAEHYFRLSYSVSLRHRYANAIGNDELGAHVSGVDPTVALSAASWVGREPSALWAAARQHKAALEQERAPGVDAHWLLNFVSGHAMALPADIPQLNLFCSLVLTDCGRFSIPNRIGAYKLTELRPLVNGRGFSYPYMAVTPTPQGGLSLNLFAPVPALRADDLEAVLKDATARIRRALDARQPAAASAA